MCNKNVHICENVKMCNENVIVINDRFIMELVLVSLQGGL